MAGTDRRGGLAGQPKEADGILAEKEQFLAQAGDDRAEALLNYSDHQAGLDAERTELLEAIQAGEAAEGSLEQVRTALQSAESWGTWDMLGGGALVTMAKHSEIDSARAEAHIAQEHLRLFQEELADADERLHVSLGEIGGFSTFADYFFDGLIVDWSVQSRVQNALGACDSVLSQVAEVLSVCHQRLGEVEQELEQVETQRRELIERAYADQQNLLGRLFEGDEDAPFVASFSAAKKQDSEGIYSYCVWAPGVDALLPRTQLVMFPRENDKVTAAEWDRVAAIVGPLMVPDESYYPVRYRAREFPSEQLLAEIEAASA